MREDRKWWERFRLVSELDAARVKAWNDSVQWFLCDGALQGPATQGFKLDQAWLKDDTSYWQDLVDQACGISAADDKKQRDDHAWDMLVLAAKASRYEP